MNFISSVYLCLKFKLVTLTDIQSYCFFIITFLSHLIIKIKQFLYLNVGLL